MSKASKVEVQKGKINANPMTMKQESREERIRETKSENALRRSGQTLDLHEPKTRRK